MDQRADDTDGGPTLAVRAAPLSSGERRLVAVVAFAPVLLAAVVLTPVAMALGAGPGAVTGASLVYGGLLGLAAGFVAVDRLQARQCPRCRRRADRGHDVCAGCRYDLHDRPRYACDLRHELYLDAGGDGRCRCGRRVQRLPIAQGLRREVAFMLKLGGWLLAFLLGVGVLLQLLERSA